MIGLGPLAFAAPWGLSAFFALPALWLVLRVLPPMSAQIRFPAFRFLLGLQSGEETAKYTPWWLLLLRLLVAGLVIVTFSRPILNPRLLLSAKESLLLVLDDGWSSAADWETRAAAATAALNEAERQGRPAMLLTTARAANNAAPELFGPRRAADMRHPLSSLQPHPWPTDRAAALAAAQSLKPNPEAPLVVLYLSDGLNDSALPALLTRFSQLGRLELRIPESLPPLLLPPARGHSAAAAHHLELEARRAFGKEAERVSLRILAGAGQTIAQPELQFADGEKAARLSLSIPVERRNEIARLELIPAPGTQPTVGGTLLLDRSWKRSSVGLISSNALDRGQSLLDEPYYLDRALAPFADLVSAPLDALLRRPPTLLLWPDEELPTLEQRRRLRAYVEEGGVLLRFAGPRLAGMTTEEDPVLLPIRLHPGARDLGTSLQWTKPMSLAPFASASPFAGLKTPEEVTVTRQVLAEPGPELTDRIWAQLVDGTPLVTAKPAGRGWLILMHVPARPDWSNLPVSGLFVEMLERMLSLSPGMEKGDDSLFSTDETLPPHQTLDGFARLGSAAASAEPISRVGEATVTPLHPPGLYGARGQRAINLTETTVTALDPIRADPAILPQGVSLLPLNGVAEVDLRAFSLTAALLLFLFDLVIAYRLRGLLTMQNCWRRARFIGVLALLAFLPDSGKAHPPEERSAQSEEFALKAALDFHLAYIVTGDPLVDATSKAGLEGLSHMLRQRTAVDAAEPMAIDPYRDELAFFPLLYWPMTEAPIHLPAEVLARINRYLRTGGTILFDTRDGPDEAIGGSGIGIRRLRALGQGLDIPPLLPAGPDHVLTKSFYLLQEFPGREAATPLWVQADTQVGGDEVSSILLTQSDFAGAWAIDKVGAPLYPVSPGGKNQREMAYRTGINIVIYALTGNYKADQLHVKAILERLGQ